MEVSVKNIEGVDTGKKVALEDSIFAIEPNDHVIYLDIKTMLGNARQGTHKSKEKSDLSGSTKKLKKQKGTGTARAGSIKSPIFRGGARVFGPQPRSYRTKLNKKVKQLARKSALSYKAQGQNITVIEDFSFDEPKTKQIKELQNKLNLDDKKSVFILPSPNKNIYLSSRNLKGVKVVTASELNTYDIVWAKDLVVMESSLSVINEILK